MKGRTPGRQLVSIDSHMSPELKRRAREDNFHPKERLKKTCPSGFVAYVEAVPVNSVLLSGEAAELDKTTMFASADQHRSLRRFLSLSVECYPKCPGCARS